MVKVLVRLYERVFLTPERRKVRWAMEDHYEREVRKLKERK